MDSDAKRKAFWSGAVWTRMNVQTVKIPDDPAGFEETVDLLGGRMKSERHAWWSRTEDDLFVGGYIVLIDGSPVAVIHGDDIDGGG